MMIVHHLLLVYKKRIKQSLRDFTTIPRIQRQRSQLGSTQKAMH